jgi:GNAT superfamily N-acetyltransferase
MPKSLGPGKWIDPRLELNLSMALRETLEATDFVHSIHGRIFVHYEQDESEQVAGYDRASLLQFGDALEHGVSGDQLGDGISGDIAEYWELLFDLDTGMWKDDLQTEFEIDRTDLLIIDCIELQPELRGHGVGALAVERVIELFGVGCGVVACKPWPLQFTPALATDPQKLDQIETACDGPGHLHAKAQNILVESRLLASREQRNLCHEHVAKKGLPTRVGKKTLRKTSG